MSRHIPMQASHRRHKSWTFFQLRKGNYVLFHIQSRYLVGTSQQKKGKKQHSHRVQAARPNRPNTALSRGASMQDSATLSHRAYRVHGHPANQPAMTTARKVLFQFLVFSKVVESGRQAGSETVGMEIGQWRLLNAIEDVIGRLSLLTMTMTGWPASKAD